MTKIREALEKLQQQGSQESPKETRAESGGEGASGQNKRTMRNEVQLQPTQAAVVLQPERFPVLRLNVEDLRSIGFLPPAQHSRMISEEFRRIKRPLLQNAFGHEASLGTLLNTIMISSALPGAGKTFFTMNLAMSMAMERDHSVLLVDADVAKPHITSRLGLEDRTGLTDLLQDPKLDVGAAIVGTDLGGIRILPAGKKHAEATELLASRRMSEIVTELSGRYSDRVIILDTPPLLVTSEAQVLASQVGQIVFVVGASDTPQQAVMQALETLDHSKPINLVLNKSQSMHIGGYYGGDYGHHAHGT